MMVPCCVLAIRLMVGVVLWASVLTPVLAFQVSNRNTRLQAHKNDLDQYKSALELHNGNVQAHQNDLESYEGDLRRYESNVAAHSRLVTTYDADVRAHNSAVETLETATSRHNAEVASYNDGVRHYNSLPPTQRTQLQKDRYDRWKADLDMRTSQLNRERSNINSRKVALDNRKAYLDAKTRELTSTADQLNARYADLNHRAREINGKKQELDDWADRINREADDLNYEAVPNYSPQPTTDTPPARQNNATANSKPPRPQLPGFNASIFGRGEGQLGGAKTFPDATTASGTMIINDVEYKWTAKLKPDGDITSAANNLYFTQIWEFNSKLGTATATLRGSASGASGDAHGWRVNVNGEEVKVVVGVQFSGNNARFVTVRKGY